MSINQLVLLPQGLPGGLLPCPSPRQEEAVKFYIRSDCGDGDDPQPEAGVELNTALMWTCRARLVYYTAKQQQEGGDKEMSREEKKQGDKRRWEEKRGEDGKEGE